MTKKIFTDWQLEREYCHTRFEMVKSLKTFTQLIFPSISDIFIDILSIFERVRGKREFGLNKLFLWGKINYGILL